jgi:hypothetical protein
MIGCRPDKRLAPWMAAVRFAPGPSTLPLNRTAAGPGMADDTHGGDGTVGMTGA